MRQYSESELRQSLSDIATPQILVVGDLMLDRYSWGMVQRISPEAPIPVLQVARDDQRLGGAGNVMMNLSVMGAEVLACGVTGKDEAGEIILGLLQEQGLDTSGVEQQEQYTTVLKHRMIAGHTHLLRMDLDPPSGSVVRQEGLIDFLKKTIPRVDAVLISDYGKGLLGNSMLRTIAALCKTHHIPSLCDPRRNIDFEIYQDFTLIKPNRAETEAAVGFPLIDQDSILRAAHKLKYEADLEYVVISLDQDGMLLFRQANDYQFLKAETQEVFDVVGAGDMVISVLAYLLAGGASIEQAGFWAQLAAGMAIQHVGVVSFTRSDLLHRFEYGETSGKIMTLEQLSRYLPHQELPLIFTNGYFDDISAGHLKFLHQLKTLNGFNVVAINSDRSISQEKGDAPLLNERERAMLLSSVESVNRVIIFDEADASHLIRTLRPVRVVKGERYRNQSLPEKDAIDEVGALIEFFPEYG